MSRYINKYYAFKKKMTYGKCLALKYLLRRFPKIEIFDHLVSLKNTM